jgi:positive regulator of sigma E activity
MTAKARVVEVDGSGRAYVELDRNPSCASCSGMCLWRKPERKKIGPLGRMGLPVGASVNLSIPPRTLVTAAVFLHGLPLSLLLAGAAVAYAAVGTDGATVIGAALGCAVGFSFVAFARRTVEDWVGRQLRILQGP